MDQQKYTFISDPGHGWLLVPLAELVALGIADKISACSYIDKEGAWCALEEDCDVVKFLRAKCGDDGMRQWWKENVTNTSVNNDAIVRRWRSYPAMPKKGVVL